MKEANDFISITIQKGESLFEALRKQNLAPELICGGNGTCGMCSVWVEGFGKLKSCQFRLPGTYQVKLEQSKKQFDIVNTPIQPEENEASVYSSNPQIAIDIGTTTVAWTMQYLNRRISGGFVNPQRQLGADVMSRILLCEKGHLVSMQQQLVRQLSKHLTAGLQELLQEDVCRDIEIAIAANTTMLHILNGWDCSGLGRAPFSPHSLALSTWNDTECEEKMGFRLLDVSYQLTELPGISAFIGADITSGIFALDIWNNRRPALLIDLGTNGEMAIGCNGKLLTASTAAGPAFEASEAALMVHASGLLKILRDMLQTRVMDEQGLLSDDYFEQGYAIGDVVITQELVRELQMAKSAIRAGIEILIQEYGVKANEIETVYLAGGMGYYIEPEDAIAVGLLPSSFMGKVVATGNSCMKGLLKYFENPASASEQLELIAQNAQEICLANHTQFEDLYIQYMTFPGKDSTCDAVE